jgi:hypothetical protein
MERGNNLRATAHTSLNDATIFSASFAPMPLLTVTPVCPQLEKCPPLTSCILPPHQLAKELQLARPGIKLGQFIGELGTAQRKHVLLAFTPKILIGPDRVEARFTAQKTMAGVSSFARSELGATRVAVPAVPAGVDKLLVVLAHWEKGAVQLGRPFYRLFENVRDFFASDVVRLEAFNADGQAVAAKVSLRLSLAHIPTERVRVLRFSVVDLMFNENLIPGAFPDDKGGRFDPVACHGRTSCPSGWPGDGVCDYSCDNPECNYDLGDCGHGHDQLRGRELGLNLTYFVHNEWTKHPDGYVDIVATAGFDYVVIEDVDDCTDSTCPVTS